MMAPSSGNASIVGNTSYSLVQTLAVGSSHHH